MSQDTHRDDIAAYLLGALNDREARDLERHLEDCPTCREELDRLRPAIEALPDAVPQHDPPPALKASVMSAVEREARPAQRPVRRRFWLLRPLHAAAVAAVLAIGIVGAFLVSSPDDGRVVTAQVDRGRVPSGTATLRVEDGRGVLRVRGFPSPGRGRTYQLWLQRDGRVRSAGLFGAGEGDVPVQPRLSDRDKVLVTREPAGGSPEPTQEPLLSVEIS
jgi:anti-sigma-K factor RskA